MWAKLQAQQRRIPVSACCLAQAGVFESGTYRWSEKDVGYSCKQQALSEAELSLNNECRKDPTYGTGFHVPVTYDSTLMSVATAKTQKQQVLAAGEFLLKSWQKLQVGKIREISYIVINN